MPAACAAEGRHKANEVVIARPDIACVLAYLPGEQVGRALSSLLLSRPLRRMIITQQMLDRPPPQRLDLPPPAVP